MKILVSSCLLGVDCRYCGTGFKQDEIIKLKENYILIPVCPEQLGGLPTPREPVEIVSDRVVDKYCNDLTMSFEKGAQEVLKIAKLLEVKTAILKANSPSCGCGQIYDGTFSGTLTKGNGVTANRLLEAGFEIYNENNFKTIKNKCKKSSLFDKKS